MKKLQEGFALDVDEDSDVSFSLSESDEDEPKTKPHQKTISAKPDDDEDLEDMDLLDPFGDEPIPVVKKKEVRFECYFDLEKLHKTGEFIRVFSS